RQLFDTQMSRGMNLGHHDGFFWSRIERAKRHDLFDRRVLLDDGLKFLKQWRRERPPHEEIGEGTGERERGDREKHADEQRRDRIRQARAENPAADKATRSDTQAHERSAILEEDGPHDWVTGA